MWRFVNAYQRLHSFVNQSERVSNQKTEAKALCKSPAIALVSRLSQGESERVIVEAELVSQMKLNYHLMAFICIKYFPCSTSPHVLLFPLLHSHSISIMLENCKATSQRTLNL